MTTHHYAICMYTDPVGQSLEPFIMFEKEANALRELLNWMDPQQELTFHRLTTNPLPYSFCDNFMNFTELNEAIWNFIDVEEEEKLIDNGHEPIDGGVDTGDENYKVVKCLLDYVPDNNLGQANNGWEVPKWLSERGRDKCKVLELFK